MDLFTQVKQMQPLVDARDWAALEETFLTKAAPLIDKELLDCLREEDVSAYQETLEMTLKKVNAESKEDPAIKAIYYEFTMFRLWEGYFYLTTEYNSSDSGDAWVCEYEEKYMGPRFGRFSDLYERASISGEVDIMRAVALALIARSVAAMGRAVDNVLAEEEIPLPVCIGLNGQDPVFRLHQVALTVAA